MDKPPSRRQSQLFTVRVWLEDLGDGKTEWRGQVKHVMSDEEHYFREWPTLVEQLKAMLFGFENERIERDHPRS